MLRTSLTGLIPLGPKFLVSETGVNGACYSFEEGFAMGGPTVWDLALSGGWSCSHRLCLDRADWCPGEGLSLSEEIRMPPAEIAEIACQPLKPH